MQEALQLLEAERDENTQRKDLTPMEMNDVGERIAKLYEPKMKERQREHGKTAPGRKKNTSSKLEQVSNGEPAKTLQAAAAAAGTSTGTYHKIHTVAQAAKEDPETFGPIASRSY